MTQSDPNVIRWDKPRRNFMCSIGIHRWESHSVTKHHKVHIYNRCIRNCPKYGHWHLVAVEDL